MKEKFLDKCTMKTIKAKVDDVRDMYIRGRHVRQLKSYRVLTSLSLATVQDVTKFQPVVPFEDKYIAPFLLTTLLDFNDAIFRQKGKNDVLSIESSRRTSNII